MTKQRPILLPSLPIPLFASYQRFFWFDMLLRHNFLAGAPRLNYLTLPTLLTDADFQRFLSALSDFLTRHRELLKLLAEEME